MRVVQARGNLAAERLPVGIDVSGPDCGGVALRSGKCGARQNEDAFLIAGCALTLVDSGGRHERKKIGIARAAADAHFVGASRTDSSRPSVSGSVVSSHQASTPILKSALSIKFQ